MRHGYRGGTSNVRAAKCRICGFKIEAGKGVKVWCGTNQHERPTLGFIHRTEVDHDFTLRYRTATHKIWSPPSRWVWHPYLRRRGRKRNPVISWIAIKFKRSPQAARAYWERHRIELLKELQSYADKSNPLATKNPGDLTYREIRQLADLARLPDVIQEYAYEKLRAMVENMNDHHTPW